MDMGVMVEGTDSEEILEVLEVCPCIFIPISSTLCYMLIQLLDNCPVEGVEGYQ
jgi:hypothetical protein